MAVKKTAAKKVAKPVDPLLEDEGTQDEEETGAQAPSQPVRTAQAEPVEEKPQRVVSGAELQKAYSSDIERTKAALEKQPKVTFMIPLAPGEKPGAYESVTINGYRLTIKKGAMVEIPKQVAEMLADHYAVELNAGKEYRTDRDSHVEEALN